MYPPLEDWRIWPRACNCSEVTAWVPTEGGTQGKECLLPSLKLSSAVDRRQDWGEHQPSLSCACMHAKSLQSCPTFCDPMDYTPPGSTVRGILQARILEWGAMPSPRDLPHPGFKPKSLMSPALAGELFTISATWEAPLSLTAQAKFQDLKVIGPEPCIRRVTCMISVS